MTQKDLNKIHAAGKAVYGKIYLNEFGERFRGTKQGRLEKVVDSTIVNVTRSTQLINQTFSTSGGGGTPAVSGSNGSFTFNTVTFGNLNGLSFYTSNGSVVGSYTVPGGGSPNFSAGTTSNNLPSVVFSNSNGVSFGLNGSTITASHNGLTTQTVQPVAISGSNGSFTYNTVTFGALNGATFYTSNGSIVASYTVPSVTNSSWTASAGTQSATVSQLVWSNSNGISFGLDNGTITASHNGLTSQTVQTQNMVSILGSTGDISFANSNGITFGGNASTITASHNGLTTQTVQPVAVSGSNGSFVFSTVTMGNLNGLSFYTSNGSLVGSYTVPTVTNSSWTASAGGVSEAISLLNFKNTNGISFGLNAGDITASHNGLTVQSSQPISWTVTGINTISGTTGSGYNFSLSFDNLSAGISGNTIRVSHQRDTHTITAANGSATYGNQFGMFNLNGVSFSTTDSGGIRGFVASHNGLTSQSNQALSGSNGSFAFQTATFGNLNGISFYTSNGSLVASHNGVTSQTVQPVAVSGSNGSFNFSTVTFGNLNGISFYTSNGSMVASYTVPAGGSPAISGSNGSFTFNTVTFGNLNGASFYSSNGSIVLSYTVPAAGGALSFSAGTSSGTFNSLVFSNANSVSFGLNGSTVTASFNAGAGADITLSMWPDRVPILNFVATTNSGSSANTGGSTQITASYHIASVQVPHPVVFDNLYGFNINSVTSAGTGSATVGHGLGLYSLDANTVMNLISSWQWQMYVSQNSVTARTHRWFWGTASSTNSSSLSGNVSASFTNPSGAGRKILLSNGVNTIPAGNYYLVSVYTCRSNGLNAYNNGSQAIMDGVNIFSAHTMMGEASITRAVGFNGVFSSTTNISTVAQPIIPSTINTSAITISGTNQSGTFRVPLIIFERSKS